MHWSKKGLNGFVQKDTYALFIYIHFTQLFVLHCYLLLIYVLFAKKNILLTKGIVCKQYLCIVNIHTMC